MKIGEQWMALFQGEENEFRLLCDPCFALPRRLESHDVERSIWFRFDSKAETSPGAKARASWFLSYLIKTHVNETIRAQCNWSFVRVDCFVADLTPELTVDRRWAWARCRSVACRFQRKVSFHSARVKTCKLYSAFRFCFSLWTSIASFYQLCSTFRRDDACVGCELALSDVNCHSLASGVPTSNIDWWS